MMTSPFSGFVPLSEISPLADLELSFDTLRESRFANGLRVIVSPNDDGPEFEGHVSSVSAIAVKVRAFNGDGQLTDRYYAHSQVRPA